MAAVGRRERKKQRMRERIVSEARALFLEQGYDKTTVADVADRVDIAVSTLFGYFSSKLDILFAGYDEFVDAWIDAVAARDADESAIDATLRLHAEARAGRAAGASELGQTWLRELATIIDADPVLQAHERERFARAEEFMAQEFSRELGDRGTSLRGRLIASTKTAHFLTFRRLVTEGEIGDREADAVGAYVDACLVAAAEAIAAVPVPAAAPLRRHAKLEVLRPPEQPALRPVRDVREESAG